MTTRSPLQPTLYAADLYAFPSTFIICMSRSFQQRRTRIQIGKRSQFPFADYPIYLIAQDNISIFRDAGQPAGQADNVTACSD